GDGRDARLPLRAGRDPRRSMPLPMAQKLHRLLGQPRLPSLCGLRLLAGGPAHGARHHHRRPAVLSASAKRQREKMMTLVYWGSALAAALAVAILSAWWLVTAYDGGFRTGPSTTSIVFGSVYADMYTRA